MTSNFYSKTSVQGCLMGVMVEITSDGGMVEASYDMRLDAGLLADLLHSEDDFKPYLRPMSSMTAKEENFYYSCLDEMDGYKQTSPVIYQDKALSLLDFLNANHFDYRGLIPMGLAIAAQEGMYKF